MRFLTLQGTWFELSTFSNNFRSLKLDRLLITGAGTKRHIYMEIFEESKRKNFTWGVIIDFKIDRTHP